jgi:ribosomal protein L15
LAEDESQVALTVRVDAASESAKKAIEGVGGKIEKPVKS